MKDPDLEILSRVTAPTPNDQQREMAVSAALDAFDLTQDEINSAVAQGTGVSGRQTSVLTNVWRMIVNSTLKPIWNMKPAAMATFAGALTLPIAGVVTWNIMQPVPLGFAPQQAVVPLTEQPPVEFDAETILSDSVIAPAKEERRRNAAKAAGVSKSIEPQPSVVLMQPAPLRNKGTRLGISSNPDGSAELDSFNNVRKKQRVQTIFTLESETSSVSGERYEQFKDNRVKSVKIDPVSTFSIDVDTASYARVRAMLNSGNLPPKDMVRVEEMINYFDYAYPVPGDKSQPFKPSVTLMKTPWNEHTKLMHIGIKGYDVDRAVQPKANLVFLLDVSGSMGASDKLPLLIKSFRLLLQKLNPADMVSIVTYAGRAGTVLEPTTVSNSHEILNALESLYSGGSTGGAQGIEQAYRLAEQSFVEGGVNRVMLATDGDFNVGISDPEQLKGFIAKKRKSGIFLSVFGFGRGNYNDALMQSLAQNGNGQAAYIDTLAEAQKSLVEEAGSTLFPIANDVKIQVELNPAKIAEYRLIGYETRALNREDFNNDKIDAGEIGAGHTVTAIYELTPVGSAAVLNDALRYQKDGAAAETETSDEIGFLKLRYKIPGEEKSKLLKTPILEGSTNGTDVTDAGFASMVAAFGQKLRGHPALSDFSYKDIADRASEFKGKDIFGYRASFVQLVRMAGSLSN